jgi:hypothetical protein
MRKSISALVAELLQTKRLDRHRRVHHADLRHVKQRDLALEVLVEQLAPAFDRPPSRLRIVAHRVGVVECRAHADVLRGSLGLVAVLVDPQEEIRRVALPHARLRRQLAGLGQIGDFIPVLDLLGIDRLPHLCRQHHIHVVVVAFGDFILIVLVQHLAEHVAVAHGLTGYRKAKLLCRFVLDLVDLANAKTDAAQAVRGFRYALKT